MHGRLGGATTTGDLELAAATCETTFPKIQPGQASNWALHLAAWWTLTAALQGNWGEVERIASRAYALWQLLDRIAAGYASRGFLAAFEVARARHDEAAMTRWRDTINEIDGAFHGSFRADTHAAVVNGDPAAAAALLASTDASAVGYETTERVISFVTDRGFVPARSDARGGRRRGSFPMPGSSRPRSTELADWPIATRRPCGRRSSSSRGPARVRPRQGFGSSSAG